MATIVCKKCGVILEAAGDGTNIYDIGHWDRTCERAASGTPLLCPKMKAAIEAQTVKRDERSKRTPH